MLHPQKKFSISTDINRVKECGKGKLFRYFWGFLVDIPHYHAAVIVGGVVSPDIVHPRCSRTVPFPPKLLKSINEPENEKKLV